MLKLLHNFSHKSNILTLIDTRTRSWNSARMTEMPPVQLPTGEPMFSPEEKREKQAIQVVEEERREESLLKNVLTLVGFTIIAIIVLWGAFHLVNLALPGLSSFFSRLFAGSDISVQVPRNDVNSGTPVDISWTHRTSDEGSYSFMYMCRDNFEFRTPSAQGVLSPIPCGVSYRILGDVKNIRVVPALMNDTRVEVPITITFLSQATGTQSVKRIEGKADITVVNTGISAQTLSLATASPASPEPPPIPTSAPTPATPAKMPAQTGKPDLSVRIISVGVIEPTGAYSSRYPTNPYDIAAVRFAVTNIGSSDSGMWYFTASLPTSPPQPYTSPSQSSLPAGYTGEYILQFRPVSPGGGAFSVFVDAGFSINEASEANNAASVSITMPYYSGTYPLYMPQYMPHQPYTPYPYSHYQ